MPSSLLIALSGATLGIAVTGIAIFWRLYRTKNAVFWQSAMFGLAALLTSLPLVIETSSQLYTYYLPTLLPALMSLPVSIYAAICALTLGKEKVRLQGRHMVLPLAGVVITLGYWSLPQASLDTLFVSGELPDGWLPSALTLSTVGLLTLWMVTSAIYLILVLKRLTTHREKLRDIYSNTEGREYRWVELIMGLIGAVWAVSIVGLVSDNTGNEWAGFAPLSVTLISVLLLVWIASSLRNFQLDALQQSAPENTESPKYERSALTTDHAAKLAKRIEDAMRRDELYLDPNLSLSKLARHVSAAENLVSQTLNEEIGQTFFDYVASWRIEHAKPLIRARDKTVSSIAEAVGFNSRSTFYKAFRRETKLTPKAWQESQDV